MNLNLSTFSYWALEPHFGENFPALEETKSKFFSAAAMCLVNSSKHEPQSNPNCNCTDTNCNANQISEDVKSVINPETMNLSCLQSPLHHMGLNNNSEKNRPYKCIQCGKTFLLKHHLTNHEKTHTGERPHVCPHCGKSFTHKYCLNTHLLLHSNERPYECLKCKKKFTLKHHLITHERVHIRAKPFICEQCGKSFPLKKQLITHEKYHRGERPFLCKECGDSFARENHLIMHLRFHGSLNSFICNQCGATFTRKFELVNHERIHGKEPLSCPTCQKEFLQKRTLIAHVKLHDNQLTRTCLHCGDHFQNEKSLITHQATVHCYEEKPPDISKIDRLGSDNYGSFGEKAVSDQNYSNVDKSIRTSKPPKIKKFFCDVCFRKFSSKHGLTQHKKRQHPNDSCPTFSCPICSKSFNDNDEFLSHSSHEHHTAVGYQNQVVANFG